LKNSLLLAVIVVSLAAPEARSVGLDTRGTGDGTPPPPVVTCSLFQDSIVVTSFADILGYTFRGYCTVEYPGTATPPGSGGNYEGGGSWNSTNGMVNEYITGPGWEIHSGGTCAKNPWMLGAAGASCNGKISVATPGSPAFLGSMKVPISAGLLNAQSRGWLTGKTLAAIELEHEPPTITEPNNGASLTATSRLAIVPYIGSGATNYALEWRALVNGAWAPQNVFAEAGASTPLALDKFGAASVWQVRARARQSTKARWSAWVQFVVPPRIKVPVGAFKPVPVTP
jgi:hypothetical protein